VAATAGLGAATLVAHRAGRIRAMTGPTCLGAANAVG